MCSRCSFFVIRGKPCRPVSHRIRWPTAILVSPAATQHVNYRYAVGNEPVGKFWLNQQQMAELFATSKPNISMHIASILKEKELTESSVVKNYLTTAADGKNYNVVFYSLEMIIAVTSSESRLTTRFTVLSLTLYFSESMAVI